MKLSSEQAKNFHRIQRKHHVSVSFILQNMSAILKFVQYAITPHIVLKRKLIRRKNRVFLRHNYLRRLIFDPSQLKRRRNARRLHSQWSKRIVMYLRRFKIEEFYEDEMPKEAKLLEKDVSKQLKEQLELLKSGKRTVPLFEEANNSEQRQSPKLNSPEDSCAVDQDSETEESDLHEKPNLPQLASTNLEDLSMSSTSKTAQDDAKSIDRLSSGSDRPNGNFLDMLISKVKITSDDAGIETMVSEKPVVPSKQVVKATDAEVSVETDERDRNSDSSSDFFGFDDNERVLGTFPGMLSTPLVQKGALNSAFVSETLNAYMRDNSLESPAIVNCPQRRYEDGLVLKNSIPPKLDMPALPEGLQGLRTVAERRTFLQRTKNVKYSIINNVGTIFRELQKRTKGHRINKHAIEALQTSSTVCLTRQSWKAASWLLTDEGNYYFQTITVDGKNFRLFGSRGNSQKKFKRSHSNRCGNISSICTDECVDRVIFRALRPIRTLERRSKLSDASIKIPYKACPLSQKCLQSSEDDEPIYGNLEVMRMPKVQLEVFPQLQKPLNDIAKRYLQLILPYDGISREWAEFSVSTLVERGKTEQIAKPRQSFAFTLPYANDRNHVLVRRVYNRSETLEGQFDSTNLSFRKEIDEKRTNGEPPDVLAEECANVLTDILNSVAIGCCENSIIKNDPDNIYKYGNNNDEMTVEKSVKKTMELHQHPAANQNKKQSRMLMELRRLNATIIDAAVSKSEEDGTTCEKENCRLGCVCASLSEGTTIRPHCGKQRCILDCNCKFPSIMRLETDGRTITTEDAFMLRRQATAKLARMEKEFTSTIVLTGSETLLINESQYDKKRRCTKIPKRYGDFVDPDEPDVNENRTSKRIDTPSSVNYPLEPIMVKEKIYQYLKHCTVNVKRLRDVKDLAPWCMVHMVYKCNCKGQAIVGNPIVVEKQEEHIGGTTLDEVAATKNRTLYSFDREEHKTNEETSNYDSETSGTDISDALSLSHLSQTKQSERSRQKQLDKRGRVPDTDNIEMYMNAKANHCRRVVPVPKNTYLRRNKKRIAHIQLFIAENETNETRLSLNEHVLRSVYYHKNNLTTNKRSSFAIQTDDETNCEDRIPNRETSRSIKELRSKANSSEKRKLNDGDQRSGDDVPPNNKKRRMTIANREEGSSLLRVNRYKDSKKQEIPTTFAVDCSPAYSSMPQEQITVPKISQIFSLNSHAIAMGTDTAAAVAAEIPQQSTEAAASAEGVTSEAFKNVFQVVIKNMNNLVSKKMQDIDLALRRESKAIPAPNDEILCIIRWNNFLEAFTDGYVYLWEVRTAKTSFMAATVKNIMPLVVNALSVVNIRALSKTAVPLMAKMLINRTKNSITDVLAVVMQGQKQFWFVKGFLRPDKTRICPKPTPETHPLLTKKINILCRLLINQQINEHRKRQENALQMLSASNIPPSTTTNSSVSLQQQSPISTPRSVQNHFPPKLKVLPMQRNISDHANSILEQMVTQAYGIVRTNITFRKIRQSEVKELFQPATMNTDHHWLVLDLSNDFSHIFFPELKDLLTLDRIQKVIAYAVTKSRIVKMQFSQKSLFNAYVTPMSRRKLYFGPFRNAVLPPKLVLLQSVDGQMMLREVYESRHNVTTKTDKTTAFWLVQKRGKLILDLEEETPLIVPPTDSALHADGIEIIDDDVSVIPNEIQQIHQNRDALTKVQVDDEYDDDCMIVESEAPALSTSTCTSNPERFNYTISFTEDSSSLVVIQDEYQAATGTTKDTVQRNFKILTPDVGRTSKNALETELGQAVGNSQQQLSPSLKAGYSEPLKVLGSTNGQTEIIPIQPVALPPEITVSVSTNVSATTPVISQAKFSSPGQTSDVSVTSVLTTNAPSELNITEPITSASQRALTDAQKDESPGIEEGYTPEQAKNLPKITASSMKWSKDLTIRKVLIGNEQTTSTISTVTPNTSLPSGVKKPRMAVVNNSAGKLMVPNQLGPKGRLTSPSNIQPQFKPMAVGQQLLRSRFPMPQTCHRPPTQALQQSVKTPTSHTVSQQIRPTLVNKSPQQSVVKKTSPTIVNPRFQSVAPQRSATSPQVGITVLTPTAINTFVKTNQQQSIRPPTNTTASGSTLLRPANPNARMRTPLTFSPFPRIPVKTSASSQMSPINPATFVKNPPNTAPTGNATKSPNSPQKRLGPTFGKPQLLSESQMRTKLQSLLNREKSTITQPPVTCTSPSGDPLHISEDMSDTIINNLPQPKLPNDMKTVRITANAPQSHATQLSSGILTYATGSGVKRNSMGAIVNRPSTTQSQSNMESPLASGNPATVVTTLTNSSAAQTPPVKGIPIELPRMKKFAIISSSNTTVITPPTSNQSVDPPPQTNDEFSSITLPAAESTPNVVQKRKVIASGLIKCSPTKTSPSPAIIAKNLIKVSPPRTTEKPGAVKATSSRTSDLNTEYGYFHANIDGLPKFVVKRVNDDFLIKVPNFNGILKLSGLGTVHNYLNQYSTQKCGKSAEEVANLKWTFKAQDRSKLNTINKSNTSLMKSSNYSPTTSKQLLSAKQTPPARPSPSNTSTANVTGKTKPIVTCKKQLTTKDSIVLVDD